MIGTSKKEPKYRERDHRERQQYLRYLRKILTAVGSKKLAFIDECGFDNRVHKRYGWSRRGQKLYSNKTGKREQRENLLAARQDGRIIAPMLVTGSVNAICFEKWLSQWLVKQLLPGSVLILDNAPIHRKNTIREIAQQQGHPVKFLQKYSPDLNKIEHDFAALKKRRQYLEEGASLDQLIIDYCSRHQPSRTYSEWL